MNWRSCGLKGEMLSTVQTMSALTVVGAGVFVNTTHAAFHFRDSVEGYSH